MEQTLNFEEEEMDLDRLSTGEKIAGVAAVLLFIFMFFTWFTAEVSVSSGGFVGSASEGGNAWDAMEVIPIFLILAVIAGVGVAVIRLSDAIFEPSIPVNAVVAVLGALATILILYRIIDPPGGGGSLGGVSVDISPAVGAFLGLIAAAGIAYGGYRAMQEEGASFGEIGERLGGGGHGGGGQPPSSTPPPPPPPPPAS